MTYDLKILIDGNELLDIDDGVSPYITGLKYNNIATNKEMELGAVASDSISFTINRTNTPTYDGATCELFVHPQDDTALDENAEIEELVGDSTDGEDLEQSDIETEIPEDESGEDMTPEEIAEADIDDEDTTADAFDYYEGIPEEVEETTTDEGEEEEWTKLGTFYVYQQTSSVDDDAITLTCYDGMAKLTDYFIPSNRHASAQSIYDDLCQQIESKYGIECDSETMPDKEIDWTITCTYREAFGYFAGLLGGYAMIGADDTLGVDYYTYNETIIVDSAVHNYTTNSAGEMEIGAVECDRGINQSDVISVGAGQAISFKNPFVGDDELSDIYDMYKSIRYTGANVQLSWHSGILAGQFIRIMTPEEYANYIAFSNAYAEAIDDGSSSDDELIDIKASMNALGTIILVCSQSVDFSGDAKSIIKSIGHSEYAKENPAPSPVDARFRNLYAEMIEADYLKAKGAFIADLASENFRVGSINGHAITDGSILAQALSSEAVETLSGTHVYYQATDPADTHDLIDGDVWYHTIVAPDDQSQWTDNVSVWNGTEWVTTPLDATMFRAGSITANEIASNTITSGNINMNELQTNIARIGDANTRHIEIDSDSVDIMEGEKVMSSFYSDTELGSGLQANDDLSDYHAEYMSRGAYIRTREWGDGTSRQLHLKSGLLEMTIRNKTTGDLFDPIRVSQLGISTDGRILGKINENFSITSHTIINSASIGAEGYTEGTTALSNDGYYPLAVSQWNSTTRYWSLNRCYFTAQAVGSGTLSWMVANHHSSAHSASMTVKVLWCKA